MTIATPDFANNETSPGMKQARHELLDRMQAGRATLAALLDKAPIDQPVLTNGWSALDWLVHLCGWEERIADAYQSLAGGMIPDWDLDRMSLDQVNALIQQDAIDSAFDAARAAEEHAYQRLLVIASSAPDADLFDPARFAWMKSVPFAEWIGDNTFGHIEEHLLDWVA